MGKEKRDTKKPAAKGKSSGKFGDKAKSAPTGGAFKNDDKKPWAGKPRGGAERRGHGKPDSAFSKKPSDNKKPYDASKKPYESSKKPWDPKKGQGPAIKSISDALKGKNAFKPSAGKPGNGGKSNDKYKKGWEKSAEKYHHEKKANSTDSNFAAAGDDNNRRRQKELKVERSMSKPNFSLVETLKASWNKVRVKSTPDDVKQALLKTMSTQMAGHVLQVTLRHDASRITQCLLQFGSAQQKQLVLQELLAKAVEIAKTPYGHFTILKAISYCVSAEDQKRIAQALRGHFVALGTNVIGARTVESVCTMYPTKLSRALRAEFYGQKFTVLLPEVPTSLQQLLEQVPGKRPMVLDHMRDLVQKFVDKGLLEFRYVHELVWEYCKAISGGGEGKRLEDLSSQLLDSTPKLITTKAGARVVCVLTTHGGAKERKKLIKVCKVCMYYDVSMRYCCFCCTAVMPSYWEISVCTRKKCVRSDAPKGRTKVDDDKRC
mgnify:CR=1 FL=1